MSFDPHQLDIIEEKLTIGFPLSVKEDIEPVKYLVASFRKIWQWYNEYPEFYSKFEEILFRSVYDDLSSKFRSSNSEILLADGKSDPSNSSYNVCNTNSNEASDDVRHSSNVSVEDHRSNSASPFNVEETNSVKVPDDVRYANADTNAQSITTDHDGIPVLDLRMECGMCDCEFPLLNNDPTYAYQMHAQTLEHIETVESLKNLLRPSIDDTTSTSNVRDASSAVCGELNLNFGTNPPLGAVLSVARAPSSVSNAECNVPSSSANSNNRRTFYNTTGIYNAVLCGNSSKVHQQRPRKEQQISEEFVSTHVSKTKDECKEDEWIEKNGDWKYCILCDVNLPGQSQLRQHMNGQVHQQHLPWVQVDAENKYSCTLCNAVKMSLCTLHEHLDGNRHLWNVEDREQKSETRSIPSLSSNSTNFSQMSITSPTGWRHTEQGTRKEASTCISRTKYECKEDEWIQKYGEWKYCILCDVNLPGQSQLRQHMNGKMHQQHLPWVQMNAGNKYSCTLCNVRKMSFDNLNGHLCGKKHLQNMEDREQEIRTR